MQREVQEREQVETIPGESQQHFRAIFDNALDPIMLADDEARYVDVNPAACDLLGYRREELLQMNVWDITPDQNQAEGRRLWNNFLAGGILTDEYTVRRKDGSTREVEFKAVAHVKPNLHLSLLRDITRRKRAEVERTQLLAELKALNESLERRVNQRTEQVRQLASELTLAEQRERHRIAQMVHDDAQQMLVALQMNLHLVGQQAQPDTRSQVQEAAAFAGEIIDALRELAVELRTPALSSEKMEDVFTWLAKNMEKKYGLHVDLIVEGPCRIVGEERRELMVRLVRELLFNVVKHAGVDHARLHMREQDETLIVSVKDDGRGFDQANLRKRRAHGEGFGLYSVGERVRLFGGRLEIHSAPGGGTHAMLTIPNPTDEHE